MALHDMHNTATWLGAGGGRGRMGGSAATGLLKISPDFLCKKKQKKQIKKPSSDLQIPPNITPKCCIILY